MSDSVRPQRWQPTRLPRPWGSPDKNTGVGCHFLLQCMKVKSESEVAQSRRTLSDPMDCSLPGSSVHGIFQARVLEWGAIAFSDHSSNTPKIAWPYAVVGKGWFWLHQDKKPAPFVTETEAHEIRKNSRTLKERSPSSAWRNCEANSVKTIYIYIYIYIYKHTHTHTYIYIKHEVGWDTDLEGLS